MPIARRKAEVYAPTPLTPEQLAARDKNWGDFIGQALAARRISWNNPGYHAQRIRWYQGLLKRPFACENYTVEQKVEHFMRKLRMHRRRLAELNAKCRTT